MHLINFAVYDSVLGWNLENKCVKGSIFDVFLESFLLRIVSKPGFSPRKAARARIYPRKTKYRGRVTKKKKKIGKKIKQ